MGNMYMSLVYSLFVLFFCVWILPMLYTFLLISYNEYSHGGNQWKLHVVAAGIITRPLVSIVKELKTFKGKHDKVDYIYQYACIYQHLECTVISDVKTKKLILGPNFDSRSFLP